MMNQFQASVVGLDSFHRRKRKRYQFDFLHDMAIKLKPGQAIRLVVPNNNIGQAAKKVWMRIKGMGIPCSTVTKCGIDQYLVFLWFEKAEAELECGSYLARVTLIRRVREWERISGDLDKQEERK